MVFLHRTDEFDVWVSIIFVLIGGVVYLAIRLTSGGSTGYTHYAMSERLKLALVLVHGAASFLLALFLPNNYLNQYEFFRNLYVENDQWIAASMLTLLFLFFVAFGLILSSIVKLITLSRTDTRDPE
jgi:phosphatidylglycerophosphate synthase